MREGESEFIVNAVCDCGGLDRYPHEHDMT